ncbi:MAG: hypothetical protein ACK4N1_12855 [Pseudorhizobium sp.]
MATTPSPSFTSTEGGLTGSIGTLSFNVKARISRVEDATDKRARHDPHAAHFRRYGNGN